VLHRIRSTGAPVMSKATEWPIEFH
jgi:hypothetical protein